jgi:hypothetical protein
MEEGSRMMEHEKKIDGGRQWNSECGMGKAEN